MKLRNLSIGYNNEAPVATAIDAELHLGEFVCLIGRNGTGKSTLLKTLAGLIPPLAGEIIVNSPLSILNCTSIVLTQTPDLHNTTCFEMVAYGRLPHTGLFGKLHEADKQAALEAIRKLHIEHLSQRNFATLSDGEKQKTMIARALAQATPYLLLDEPSAFLDHPSKVELMQTLKQLAHTEQKGILLSTHDLELAHQYADTLWEMGGGSLTL